jgi:uncharacterized protein YndB with AHSA1/START domain
MVISSSHRFTFRTRATPEEVWSALTCPVTSRQYLHDMSLVSEWEPGSPVELHGPDGHSATGEVVAAARPHRLSFALEQGTAPCRIIGWDLRAHPDGTVVRLTVDDVDGDSEEEVEDVWLPILTALQSVLDPVRP